MTGDDGVTAEELKVLLNLKPHPREGGWYVRTYEAHEVIPQSALAARYSGPRLTGTAIYYLLEPDSFSEMHRLHSDEVFHFYLGDAVEMLQMGQDDSAGWARRVLIGNDLAAGQSLQLVVPRGVWQGSRLVPGGKFALLGCTVSPGFDFADYEAGKLAELAGHAGKYEELLRSLTKE